MKLTGVLAPNDALRKVELIGKGRLNNPEDVAFDVQGRMYVGSRDIIPGQSAVGKADVNPRIERVTFNADGTYSIEEFVKLPGGGPLDLRFDTAGNLIVASWGQGLISINPNREVKVLVADGTIIDGQPFGYADGVANGEVIPISPATATISGGNRVEQLLVQEGMEVKAGQIIAIMDNNLRLQASLKEAQQQSKVAMSD